MTSTPERKPSIKDSIERHPVVWFLGTLLVGFLAGLGAYDRVQDMAGIQPTTQATLDRMDQQRARLEEDFQSAQEELRQASEELKKLKARPTELRNRVTELERQNGALERKNNELAMQLAALRASSDATTPELAQKNSVLEQQIQEARIAHQTAIDKLTRQNEEMLQLESHLKNMKKENTSLTSLNKELLSKVAAGQGAKSNLTDASVLKGKRIKIEFVRHRSEDALVYYRLLKEAGAKVTLDASNLSSGPKGSVFYADETFLEAALHIQKMPKGNYFFTPFKKPELGTQNLDLLVLLR